MPLLLIVLTLEVITNYGVSSQVQNSDEFLIEVIAPEIQIGNDDGEDIRICHSVKLPEGEKLFAIGFHPTVDLTLAHHATLYSCIPGVQTSSTWECGPSQHLSSQFQFAPFCSSKEQKLYGWAKNASGFDLPQDVGYELQEGSQLVLDLHLMGSAGLSVNQKVGINVVVTRKRPAKIARLFFLYNAGNTIRRQTTKFLDLECTVGYNIHPFFPVAFRVHSHNLGTAIMGYKIDGITKEWTLLGARDPRSQQGYYLTENSGTVLVMPGDTLAARCVMVNDLDHDVNIGHNDSDEMCVFYIVFYLDGDSEYPPLDQVLNRCGTAGDNGRWNKLFPNVPQDANTFDGIAYQETN